MREFSACSISFLECIHLFSAMNQTWLCVETKWGFVRAGNPHGDFSNVDWRKTFSVKLWNYASLCFHCISWNPFLSSSPSNDFWKFTCGVGNSLPSYCKPLHFSHSAKDGCCTYVARYVKFNTPTEYSNWKMSCNCTARWKICTTFLKL